MSLGSTTNEGQTTPQPVRLQYSRKKGSRLVSPNGLPVVIVDRRTKWGNPWKARSKNDLSRVVELFRQHIARHHAYYCTISDVTVADIKRELKGKNLACWCPLFDEQGVVSPCHADVLLEIAREEPI